MSKKNRVMISALFYLAAVYDFILGATFLVVPRMMFTYFNVPFPNHWGYVQLPGAFLVIVALMFLAIARAPVNNRQFIPYGILFKVAYTGVICGYWLSPNGNLPDMWKPFAVADGIFAVLFAMAYFAIANTVANKTVQN